jgi:hypothetical protein
MRRFSGQSLPEPMRHRSESPLAAKQHSAPRKQGEQELSEAFRADCLTSCEDPSCQAFGVLFGVSQVRQIERKKEMTADPMTHEPFVHQTIPLIGWPV